MKQKEIEVILTRQLASYLAMPIFLVDPEGNLVYFNEPAEAILGRRFEETGEMALADWAAVFSPTDDTSASIPADDLPLVIALRERRPAHLAFWIKAHDDVVRHIEVTAIPLIGQANRMVGAFAIFWEAPP